MVYRVYVEKKAGLQNQAEELKKECSELLGVKGLTGLRILNRYDAENLSEELFESAVFGVFAEPQLDDVYRELPKEGVIFAVEYLPGQFDQRADSAAQCIQILSCGVKPDIRTAKVYVLEGNVSKEDVEAVKKHVINPVESREADLALPATLATEYHIPEAVATVTGFCDFDKAKLEAFGKEFSLAMDLDDLLFCQAYFTAVGAGTFDEETTTESPSMTASSAQCHLPSAPQSAKPSSCVFGELRTVLPVLPSLVLMSNVSGTGEAFSPPKASRKVIRSLPPSRTILSTLGPQSGIFFP